MLLTIEIPENTEEIKTRLRDEPDHRILECAVTAKADVIVTGDQAMFMAGRISGYPHSVAEGLFGERFSLKNASPRSSN